MTKLLQDTVIGSEVQAYDGDLQAIAGLTPSTGDLMYYNGTNWVNLGIGTAGQALQVNTGATAPEWADAGGGGADTSIICNGYQGALNNNSTAYCALGGITIFSGSDISKVPITQAGTLSDFRWNISSNAGNGVATLTIRKNGADTSLSVTIPTATAGTFADTTNTVSVTAGDLLSIKLVNASTSGNMPGNSYSVLFTPS